MDLETIGANPVPVGGGGVAPKAAGKHDIGQALLLGLAACWVAAGVFVGMFVAPVATLAWVVCVGGMVWLGARVANTLDDRIYERVASGHCAQCGYDLQGSGPRGECPQCGAWFGPGWGAAIPKGKVPAADEAFASEPQQLTSSPQTETSPADARTSA